MLVASSVGRDLFCEVVNEVESARVRSNGLIRSRSDAKKDIQAITETTLTKLMPLPLPMPMPMPTSLAFDGWSVTVLR